MLELLYLIFGQLRENGKNGFSCTNKNNNKTLQPYVAFSQWEKYGWDLCAQRATPDNISERNEQDEVEDP